MIFYEVPVGFCRADMIVFQKNNDIIALELKLANWKKAVVQAQNYQLAADFVYVVFPVSKCDLVLKRVNKTLEEKGIGLISVDERTKQVRIVINAKRSAFLFGRLSKQEIINQKKKGWRKRL